jgi:hypothetical protein
MMGFFPYIPHPEWLVVLLMVGLYAYESACLLYRNEFVLIPSGSAWKVAAASSQIQLLGKGLYLASPLDMGKPAFRLDWSATGATGPAPAWDCSETSRVIRQVGFAARAMALLMVLLGTAIVLGNINAIAAGLVGFYGLAIATIIRIWMARLCLGMRTAQVLSLGFEVICCPPFGPNLARRLSFGLLPQGDGIELASRVLTPAQWCQLVTTLSEVQQELVDFASASLDEVRAMEKFNAFLQKERQICLQHSS